VCDGAREHFFALLLVVVGLDEKFDVANAARVKGQLGFEVFVEGFARDVVTVEFVNFKDFEEDFGGE
jgi:hypothetical protein